VKKRFTEAQIIGFLREAEAGVPVKDLCRKHGFSEASYYLWRSKFGGMNVSDAKRLKELTTENARLQKLLAESLLENEVTREALRKSGSRTSAAPVGAAHDCPGAQRAAGSGRGQDERVLAAVSASTGPESGVASADRRARAPTSTVRGRDDLPQAAPGRRAREPQASGTVVCRSPAAGAPAPCGRERDPVAACEPLPTTPADLELSGPVEAIQALVVHDEPLARQENLQPAVPEPRPRRRVRLEPRQDGHMKCALLPLIAPGRGAQADEPTRPPQTRPAMHQPPHRRPTGDGAYPFFRRPL